MILSIKNVIVPKGSNTLRTFTDDELKLNNGNWTGAYYDKANLKAINAVLGNYGTSDFHVASQPFISGRISLQPLDYVLLSSFG